MQRLSSKPDAIDAVPAVRDEQFRFDGYHSGAFPSVCRLRCYEPADSPPVIVCTELPDNPGTSITNMAEYLAPEVIRRLYPARLDDPEGVIWIEHYPHERSISGPTYDRVTFRHGAPRRQFFSGKERITLGSPAWKRLTPAQVLALLRGEQEALRA